MNLAAILLQIDAEIDKLQRARTILAHLATPIFRTEKKVQPLLPAPSMETQARPEAAALPSLTIVPPREKRQYRRAARSRQSEPRALSSTVSSKPIFVPKATAIVGTAPVGASVTPSFEALEAALRYNLLSRSA